MQLGIPKEIMPGERRLAATPETVAEYRRLGYDVWLETSAGSGVYIDDGRYEEAGAKIAADARELYRRADLVLKVKQPMYNESLGAHEVELMNPGSKLVSFLHPAAPSNHKLVKLLQERRITSFTLDSIPRTLSHAQGMDALTSMSTVTGYRSVLMAANRLPRFVPVIGTAVGVTRPARFLILGAGVVGLQAIATAKRLGGVNTAVDIRPEAREQATSLGAKVAGFEVPSELAQGEGGYSSALPEEWLSREREALAPLLAESDVVISSALVPGERAPLLITESMVREMRPGSVLVDVAIDQGGNCSLTRAGEETEVGGILVCGLQNIPGGMPVDSTWLYAQNVCHFVQHLYHAGGADPDLADEIIRATLVTHEGRILHAGTLKAMRELEGSAVSSEA
jgi:H+-translocating NAD(P) transhydrogenase subunit alpha